MGVRELIRESGGRLGEEDGVEVVRSFEDPAAEYGAVREGCGIAWRADRRLIELTGRDPERMLQGLITNDLADAPADSAVYGAMLTPKGRVITDVRVVRDAEAAENRIWMEISACLAEPTEEHLRRYVPPMFAKWRFADDRVVVGVYGPRSGELLEAAGIPLPEPAEDAVRRATVEGEPVIAVGTAYTGGPGFDLLVSEATARGLWTRLTEAGAVPVGHGALETLRVEAGRPRGGRELTDAVIATEALDSSGLMDRAVSFSKGCYTGQEVIVRIAHRGRVNRLLRGLRLGDRPTPERGTPLLHPEKDKEVGWVTTAVASPRMGETIALGFVRREHEPGDAVRLGDGAATVSDLPFSPE